MAGRGSASWLRSSLALMAIAGAFAILASCATIESASTAVDNALTRDTTPPLSLQAEPMVRVRIAKGARTTKIDGPSALVVRPLGAGAPASMAPPLTVASGGSGIRVSDAKGQAKTWPMGSDVEIVPSDSASGRALGSIKIDGVPQPGFVTIRANWSEAPEQFDVIATMGIEGYLPGVVVGEMFNDWPRQAYEAQAVAARTYAIHERERAMREGRGFDVESSTVDQVYSGSSRHMMSSEAVRATRGMLLLDDGRVLRAYYSSCCGGRPASAGDVWSVGPGFEFNRATPLQGKARKYACTESKHYRWEANRTDEDLSKRLRAWGHASKLPLARVTRVREIKAATFNDAHRPSTYRVVDDGGREFTLTAEELRVACNYNVVGLAPLSEQLRVRSGDLDFEFWAGQVRIHGRGFGHGVGMCQFCAKGFADQGMDWRTMMREFFPGAEVRKMY